MSNTKTIHIFELDDRKLSDLIGDLTKCGQTYGQTQQLRGRIAEVLTQHRTKTEQRYKAFATAEEMTQARLAADPHPLTDEDRERLKKALETSIKRRPEWLDLRPSYFIGFDNHTFHRLPNSKADLTLAMAIVEYFVRVEGDSYMSLLAHDERGIITFGDSLHTNTEYWHELRDKVQAWFERNLQD